MHLQHFKRPSSHGWVVPCRACTARLQPVDPRPAVLLSRARLHAAACYLQHTLLFVDSCTLKASFFWQMRGHSGVYALPHLWSNQFGVWRVEGGGCSTTRGAVARKVRPESVRPIVCEMLPSLYVAPWCSFELPMLVSKICLTRCLPLWLWVLSRVTMPACKFFGQSDHTIMV
jgi:hypothetical protein